MRASILSVFVLALLVSITGAQSPMTVVVPAMTPAKATTAQDPVAAAVTPASTQTTLKVLQAMKVANDEILKQQAATLLKLDEVEKAAQELRIYSKRG